MRLREITAPASHPYLAEFVVDTDRLDDLGFLLIDNAKTRLLWVEDVGPRAHRFHVACRHPEVARWMEHRWS